MREMSDEIVEVTVVEKAAEAAEGKLPRRKTRRKDAAEGGDGLGKWERFLPKIALRVLLVEADDSTRQIISSLLRKCSYRVATVPDGLKAWETLKANPESVDLILTEVDLPSISGYALLTLIMEHDTCKNIPVIMMSTQDSVNTVYKCMLKGASDYLVKPLRRNELRNLWQHVWRRRQISLAPPDSFPHDESVGHQETRPEMEGESSDVEETPKEAIDFMGALFTRNSQHNREESVAKYESRIELDLSLRRPNQSSLHPSSGSAFTRYVHKPLQTQCSVSPLGPDQRKNDNIVVTNQYNSSEPPPSAPRRNEASFYNGADSPGPPSWLGQGSYPTQVPIKSIHFTGPPNTAYVSPSPYEYSSMFHPFNGNKPEGLQEHNVKERKHVFSATGHSTSYIDYHHQILENKKEEGKTQQSLREAALNKFRMKRKDRCFDKKVRYENRKKLAEQRPRIKGQFVRQVQSTETSTQEAPQ